MSGLKVVWTSQLKKDYKVTMKSHLEMDLLDGIIKRPVRPSRVGFQIQRSSSVRELEVV